MDVRETGMILATLMLAYPNTNLRDGTEMLWADEFKNFAFVDVMEAVREYIRHNPYWPPISDIRDIVREQRDRRPSPHQVLGPGETTRKIRRQEWTAEELESMRAERRRVLDGLRNEGGDHAGGQ